MANDGRKLIDKFQVGTGDIDNSTTLGNNSSMTTNNNTRITVENGGTLHYKDAETVKMEHEQRRADFNNFCDKTSEIGQKLHDSSFLGKFEKGVKDFEAGMDKICGCKSSNEAAQSKGVKCSSSRFDSMANAAPLSGANTPTDDFQK